MWYKKEEQPTRIGFWYLGTGIGVIVGAIASFGFQHYVGHSFTSWQIMFLVFGIITCFVGICVVVSLYFVMLCWIGLGGCGWEVANKCGLDILAG